MDRRSFLRLASLAPVARLPAASRDARGAFAALRARWVRESLRFDPIVATYLGAAGLGAAELDARLPDRTPAARAAQADALRWAEGALADTPVLLLDEDARVDHALIGAQAAARRRALDGHDADRALDAFVGEPFRAVSLQVRAMLARDAGGEGTGIGTRAEWERLLARVADVPRFLADAQASLEAAIAAGRPPDRRMVANDGIPGASAAAGFFADDLVRHARPRLAGAPWGEAMCARLARAGGAAAVSFRAFGAFLRARLDPSLDHADRFAIGTRAYDLRLRGNLDVPATGASLFSASRGRIDAVLDELCDVAARVASGARLQLSFAPHARLASTRAVFAHLAKDAPRDDDELFALYVAGTARAVAWAEENGWLARGDAPPPPVPTPELFRGTVSASYFPAPPFARGGAPRFYVTPTGGDADALAASCRASILVTVVHELIPGHHWHYRRLAGATTPESAVRWLTPGAVESSLSMWEDSMAVEGWATLAEEIAGRPLPGRPFGLYSAEEKLFQLQSRLLGEIGIRCDAGLHTGALSFDEALDEVIATMELVDRGTVTRSAGGDADARTLCDRWEPQIYRYSKWPTQALTYPLGRDAILALRDESGLPEREFLEWFLRQGTIPPRRLLRRPAPRLAAWSFLPD